MYTMNQPEQVTAIQMATRMVTMRGVERADCYVPHYENMYYVYIMFDGD